jgi:hypothetical protein
MVKANTEYAKALGLINSALRSPSKAKEDQTLMIVLLLGMYEEVGAILFCCEWILT